MASTDLKLDAPGTLPKPGPIGRTVRLAFGFLCLSMVIDLVSAYGALINDDGHIKPIVWVALFIGLYLISYIINIGFSRAWGKRPAIISALIFAGIAMFSYLNSGIALSALLANAIGIWAIYLFSHIGIAFFLSGLIATPGCEMRAFHDLFSRATGIATSEHCCPIGPMNRIDHWEANRTKGNL